MNSSADFARETDPLLLRLKTSIRRMAVSLTTKVLWQLVGHKLPDGTTETVNAEPFNGIGFYALPPSDGKPEAIVLQVGGSQTLVIVGVRDEKTRAASAGSLKANESAMFNTLSIFIVKDDGVMEARSIHGAALAVAQNPDLAALVSTLSSVAPGFGSGDAAIAALQAYVSAHPGFPIGSTKLKAE